MFAGSIVVVALQARPAAMVAHVAFDLDSQVGGWAYAVRTDSARVFVGMGPRLQVLQVVDADSMTRIGVSRSLPGLVLDVVVRDDLAYVALGDGGVAVLDVGHLPSIGVLSNNVALGSVSRLAVVDEFVYAVVNGRHIVVLATTLQNDLALIRTMDESNVGAVRGIAVVDHYLFVVSSDANQGELVVVDVSRPATPSIVGRTATPGRGIALAVSGEYAFIAAGRAGLHLVDVSDKSRPILARSTLALGYVHALCVVRNRLFLGISTLMGQELLVADISRPAEPRTIASHRLPGSIEAIAGDDPLVFVADGSEGLSVVTYDEQGLVLALSYRVLGYAVSVASDGRAVYVADYGAQALRNRFPTGVLRAFDIRRAIDGQAGFWADTPGVALDVAVDDRGIAAIADGQTGVTFFDVDQVERMWLVSTLNTPEVAVAVAMQGALAYVADLRGGLRIIDISDWRSPREIGSYGEGDVDVDNVVPYGDVVFITTTTDVRSISIESPERPVEIDRLRLSGTGMYVMNDLLYVTGGESGGLYVVDVSDPASLVVVGVVATHGWSNDVVVRGDLAVLCDGPAGVHLVDVSRPEQARIVATYDTPGWAQGVVWARDRVYVADSEGGLLTLAVSGADGAPQTPTSERHTTATATAPATPPLPSATLSPTPVPTRRIAQFTTWLPVSYQPVFACVAPQ